MVLNENYEDFALLILYSSSQWVTNNAAMDGPFRWSMSSLLAHSPTSSVFILSARLCWEFVMEYPGPAIL